MKLLVITDFVPYPPYSGATWRVYGLLSHLCKRHQVVLVVPIRMPTDPEGVAHLEEIGMTVVAVSRPEGRRLGKAVWTRLKASFSPIPMHWVLTWDDAIARAISAAIGKHDPDIVQVEHLGMCRFYDSFAVGKPLVLDQHNVERTLESDVARSMSCSAAGLLRKREARKVPAFERDMMSRMDLVLAVSDLDRAELQQMAPGTKMVTIPNGVELEFFAVAEPASSKTVVFTGTLDYQPNIEAALDLASEVLPRVRAAVPDVKARIVGRRPVQAIRDLAGPGLEVVPDVEDIRTYIQEAAVVAVPLKSGSGTRIKILEAMAMGKAVVSTRKGAEGLDVRDGYDILLRDDMPGFADAVAELLGSPEERQKVGRNARSTVEAGYGYEALALRLEAALLDLLQRK